MGTMSGGITGDSGSYLIFGMITEITYMAEVVAEDAKDQVKIGKMKIILKIGSVTL